MMLVIRSRGGSCDCGLGRYSGSGMLDAICEGNLKTLTAVVSKYIENLLQTLVKNFIYYRVPFYLCLSDRVYFVIQTPKSSLNLMS